MTALLVLAVFFSAYALTIVVTSVGYHRGLAHGAVRLHPWARRALLAVGPWLTSFDPKVWVVMHRLHHKHSDTVDDPHSPKNGGFFGIFGEQLRGYQRVQQGLIDNDPELSAIGDDLPLSFMVRSGRWWLPWAAHAVFAVAVAFFFGLPIAIALTAGLLSHVVQGAIINYFGHAHGGRNFDTNDDSRNNHLAAWLVLGEGFQNNHHRFPSSARFSYRAGEVDFGYFVCRVLEAVGVLHIVRRTLLQPALPA